ncbi:MAG: DUF4417 domain-containing protein [Anaerolineae bacterium]|nr:DUF4417 domain-containing protein [Anaerolineae bacterium]
MRTRSSPRWQHTPGSFDALHTGQLFPTDGNAYHIPSLPHAPLTFTPTWLAPYRTRIRSADGVADGAVHFFLDDYRFESVWSHPHKALRYLTDFKTLLTPDFSLYPEWPLAVQVWNVYRSRWCGAFWASRGFQVIPTASWAGRDSYDFCFAGIARHSLVAISRVGIRAADESRFAHGFREMVERIRPSRVLCYSSLRAEWCKDVDVSCYPTRWDGIKGARHDGR